MRTISALELRNNLETIIKRLQKGERLELTYRGQSVGQLIPMPRSEQSDVEAALERLAKSHADDPDYAQKADQYLHEVYEDRRAYGGREVAE